VSVAIDPAATTAVKSCAGFERRQLTLGDEMPVLKKMHVMEVVQHAAAYLQLAADQYPEVAAEMRALATRLSVLAQAIAALPARDGSE
jgi:hypothetical protein